MAKDKFTVEEVNSILDSTLKQTGSGPVQYVGARYVPIFADAPWSSTNQYEPLTIVLYEGNSYTSRQSVPVGINITNEDFWAQTGNYNAQIEQYRNEVKQLNSRITANAEAIDAEKTRANEVETKLSHYSRINVMSFGADNTGKTDSYNAILSAIESANEKWATLYFPTGNYMISQKINLTDTNVMFMYGENAELIASDNFNGEELVELRTTNRADEEPDAIVSPTISGFTLNGKNKCDHLLKIHEHPRVIDMILKNSNVSDIIQASGNDATIINIYAKNRAATHQAKLCLELTQDAEIDNAKIWGYDTAIKFTIGGGNFVNNSYFWCGYNPRECVAIEGAHKYDSLNVNSSYFDTINTAFKNIGFMVSNSQFYYLHGDSNEFDYKITKETPHNSLACTLNNIYVSTSKDWDKKFNLLPSSTLFNLNNILAPYTKLSDDAYASGIFNLASGKPINSPSNPAIIQNPNTKIGQWCEIGRIETNNGKNSTLAILTNGYSENIYFLTIDIEANTFKCSPLSNMAATVNKNTFGYKMDGTVLKFYCKKSREDLRHMLIRNVISCNNTQGIFSYQIAQPTAYSDTDISQFTAQNA